MKAYTIKDIAEKSGVSKSTVSRVINNTGYVSKESRDRVNEIIAAYSYQPSVMARSLSSQHSQNIAVVVPTLSNVFFSRLLNGIGHMAEKSGYAVMYFLTDDDPDKELQILASLRGLKPAGLMITPSAGYLDSAGWKALDDSFKALGVPVVTIDRGAKKSDWDGVYFDNYNGAYMATESLIRRGCKRIGAMIADTSLRLGYDRLSGFCQAMNDYGLPIDDGILIQDKRLIPRDRAFELTSELIENKTLPEAMFVSNFDLASGFYKALVRFGYTPGKDIFSVSFDPVEAMNIFDLKYDYIEHDYEQIGKVATQMLMDHFEQKIESRREYVVPAKLVRHG